MVRVGEPTEIADDIAFRLSERASYVTGEVLFADGKRVEQHTTTECRRAIRRAVVR